MICDAGTDATPQTLAAGFAPTRAAGAMRRAVGRRSLLQPSRICGMLDALSFKRSARRFPRLGESTLQMSRGQLLCSSRDNARSASTLPPVWQTGQ